LDQLEPPAHQRQQVHADGAVCSLERGGELAGVEHPDELFVPLSRRRHHHLSDAVATEEGHEAVVDEATHASGQQWGQDRLVLGEAVGHPALHLDRFHQLVGEVGGERVDHLGVPQGVVHGAGHGIAVVDGRPGPGAEHAGEHGDHGDHAQEHRQGAAAPVSAGGSRHDPNLPVVRRRWITHRG
jgi:hypothetical protein